MPQGDQAAGQVVGSDQPRSRLREDANRASLAHHGLLLDVELDPLHVRQYDFGRKQPAAAGIAAPTRNAAIAAAREMCLMP